MNKKELIPFKSNNIIEKIIGFFRNLFFKNKSKYIVNENVNLKVDANQKIQKSSFRESIVMPIKDEDKVDMKLLIQYRNGYINEDEMTDEQFECLCNTYQARISQLKESNRKRKERLLVFRKQMQTSN